MGLAVQLQVYWVLLGEETMQVSAESESNLLCFVILFRVWCTVKGKIGPIKIIALTCLGWRRVTLP